ncbi:MAG TPA: hypothetical protein VF099_15800 [Ktedonobacterales bacterium]
MLEQGRDDDQYPSIGFSIEVAATGFRGRNHEVWFALEELHQFLAKVRQLDQDRSGLAMLTSMSPDEACIAFFALDRSGHLALKVDLKKDNYLTAGGPYFQAVSVTFEIDPSTLPGIVRELAVFVQANGLQNG